MKRTRQETKTAIFLKTRKLTHSMLGQEEIRTSTIITSESQEVWHSPPLEVEGEQAVRRRRID